MINRNQILSDARQCIRNDCNNCSQSGMYCIEDLITDMLNLLEAVAPIVFMDGLVKSYKCRNCGKHLVNATYARDNYCSKCGKAIKWE